MYREMSKVSASAAGTAIQAPLMPRKCGSTSRQAAVKTKVRQNERIADTLPLDNAVKNPEDVMLTPLNKKQKANKRNPVNANGKVSASWVNIVIIGRDKASDAPNKKIEDAMTNRKEIRYTRRSKILFRAPY